MIWLLLLHNRNLYPIFLRLISICPADANFELRNQHPTILSAIPSLIEFRKYSCGYCHLQVIVYLPSICNLSGNKLR